MRPVRPTVKVLLDLPRGDFDDPAIEQLLIKGDRALLERIDQISHSVLNAARAALAHGRRCEQHHASTKAAKQAVYEIEEKSSGWRGAVVLDDAGDPWLVYVNEHDKFHRTAAEVLKDSRRAHWGPGHLDYDMRRREDHAQAGSAWMGEVAAGFVALLEEALDCTSSSGSYAVPPLPGEKSASTVRLSLELEHDRVQDSDDATTAHLRNSMAEITIRITRSRDQPLHDMLLQVLARLLDPELRTAHPAYLIDGGLLFMVALSQAHVIELVALLRADGPNTLQEKANAPLERTHRHYILANLMTEKVVEGAPARAVCGEWFVPIQYGEELPVCSECERHKPIAQAVIDAMRASQPVS